MKLSKNKLSEAIKIYLNDIEDYGDTNEYMLAEATLKPITTLILESKSSTIDLNECLAVSKNPFVIQDLIIYIQNI
jgi:hypothetical protein